MVRVVKCRAQPLREGRGLSIGHTRFEPVQRVERVQDGIERRCLLRMAFMTHMPDTAAGGFFLQMRGVQEYQTGQIARCGGGEDLAGKAQLHQQWQATAMIEMGMSQKNSVD